MLTETIKEATKADHLALEKQVVKRLKAIESGKDYAELLKYFYAYFSKVEAAVAPFITSELLPDYSERRNASYIKADIEALGETLEGLPQAQAPEVSNLQQALGALYVLEGSIMGGRIIVEMLAKAGITQGVSFFSGYGPETGVKWQRFTSVLNAQAQTDQEQQQAIDSAQQTFARFGEVFQRNYEVIS